MWLSSHAYLSALCMTNTALSPHATSRVGEAAAIFSPAPAPTALARARGGPGPPPDVVAVFSAEHVVNCCCRCCACWCSSASSSSGSISLDSRFGCPDSWSFPPFGSVGRADLRNHRPRSSGPLVCCATKSRSRAHERYACTRLVNRRCLVAKQGTPDAAIVGRKRFYVYKAP